MRSVNAVDLFCGAGGASRGLLDAGADLGLRVKLLAINHWSVAIATHEKNLPGARHMCADVAAVDPRGAVPGGHLDLLWASPECRFHSVARGGRPINDQQRADPWQVVRWLSELYVRSFIIENVSEFKMWGPLDARGRPLKSRRGETYQAFLTALRGLGYAVEDRLLNAADYGDPTTRRRLFILGRRDGKKITWPEPTHARPGNLLGLPPWRSARDAVIDWSTPSQSIFARKRPLSRNTMERIIAGLQRFGGPELGPFLVVLKGTDPEQLQRSARPVELPVGAVHAGGNHFGLVEPRAGAFTLSQQSGGAPRGVGEPVQTVATRGAISLVEFLVPRYTERDGQKPRTHSVDEPMPTVPASNQHGLAQAFILPPLGVHHRKGKANKPRSVEDPLQTVTASRGGGHLVEPFIVQVNHGDNPKGSGRGNGKRVRSIDQPLHTVQAQGNGLGVVEPFLVHVNHGKKGEKRGRTRSVEEPVPTVTADRRGLALVQALIAKYYGTGIVKPVTEPLDTVTTKDRFGLVTFEKARGGLALDIRFRMLKPRELARAQGFTDDYTFEGDVGDQVRQIGNAVPRRTAMALSRAQLQIT